MKNASLICLALFFALAAQVARANNISISNVSLTGATATYVYVQFDLSWDNSWRLSTGPANWDAAWVFVKFSASGGGGPWGHATLSASGHTAPSGSTITPSADGKGVFIYRSANGSGANTWTGVQLKWDFAADGLAGVASTVVQVFGVEMVYVPQGAFAAGSGGTEANAFTLTTINTANATTAPSGTGSLGGQAGGYPTGQPAPTQANWPNGYNAFYIMKYEGSEGQWISFFNTLTLAQMATRDITTTSGKNTDNILNRNTISWITGFATSSAPDRPCNFMTWTDVAAYLDWAGLRPMTELEFEKACRGAGQLPVENEFVWGNTGAHPIAYTLSNDGTPNELIANPGSDISEGNALWNQVLGSLNGPVRCGIFAASAPSAIRSLTGGTYYGVMEMGGNLAEYVVNINAGNSYTGNHGDGYLSNSGNANVSGWPNPFEVLAGLRGGRWSDSYPAMRTSARNEVFTGEGRGHDKGIRGVRTAP